MLTSVLVRKYAESMTLISEGNSRLGLSQNIEETRRQTENIIGWQ